MNAKTSPRSSSVYRSQNAQVRAVFDHARSARKVLCVALDHAKSKHVALICDGSGDILKSAFPVENSPAGVGLLIKQISATARRRKIARDCIYLGGEDETPYVANFTAALREKGYLVVRVNAYEAKENRENLLAKHRQPRPVMHRQNPARPPRQADRRDYRQRSRLFITSVRSSAAAVLSSASKPPPPTASTHSPTNSSPASFPMPKAASPSATPRSNSWPNASAPPKSPASLLHRHRVHAADETAAKIIALARQALPPAAHRVATLQRMLAATADLYRCLHRNALELRADTALTLATTPYAFLTSIPGIGFVLAAGIAGELGDPKHLAPLDSLCAYADIVPRSFQSGAA